MIFRQFLFFVIFVIELFLTGSLAVYVLKLRKSLTLTFCLGFISILSLFFPLAWLFRLTGGTLSGLTASFLCVLALADAVSLFIAVRNSTLKDYCSEAAGVWNTVRENKLLYGLLFLSFLFNIFLTCCYWATSDDSYYLPRAMEMIANNTVNINDSVAWLGYETEYWPATTDVSTLEALRAVFSYTSGIPVAVLNRNVFSLILILISYASVWQLTGSAVYGNEHSEKIKVLTLLFYNFLIMLVGGFLKRDIVSLPFWQIRYIWQGKSVLVAILMPFIMKVCIDIYNSDGDNSLIWRSCLLLAWLLLACISASVVGVIFPAVFCFVLAVPYIVMKIIRKDFQWQIIVQMLVAVLPVILISGGTFLYINRSFGSNYLSSSEILDIHSWNGTFGSIFKIGHWVFWALYAIALLYLLIKGTRTQRAVFISSPIVLFLTFLNPLLINFVAKTITTTSVYSRLYWLLPMWYAFPFALAVFLCEKLSKREIKSFTAGLTAALALCGYLRIWDCTELRSSMYSLDRRTEAVAQFILDDFKENEKPVVLDMAKQFLGVVEIRQYSTDIVLFAGHRDNQRGYLPYPELEAVYDELNSGEMISNDEMMSLIETGGIDYVTGKTDEEAQFGNLDCLTKVFTCDDFVVWAVK